MYPTQPPTQPSGQHWAPPPRHRYEPPAGYAAPPAPAPLPRQLYAPERNGFGTAGMVLGLIALVFSFIPLIGVIAWPLWPLGLGFAAAGLLRCRHGEASNRGVAIAGLVSSIAAALVCMIWALGIASNAAQHPSATHPTFGAVPAVAGSSATPATASGPATTVQDGTYQVGVDMVPGRYKTSGPSADAAFKMCYWGRSKDDSGQLESIIANDNIQGRATVTVKKGEFFKTSGGCTWTKS